MNIGRAQKQVKNPNNAQRLKVVVIGKKYIYNINEISYYKFFSFIYHSIFPFLSSQTYEGGI
jgi:hypothetical protein